MRTARRGGVSVACAMAALALVLSVAARGYFSAGNLSDLFLSNLPVLLIALGMTLVIVTGEIDISVGSMFAICGVAAGILAESGWPVWPASAAACPLAARLGSPDGGLAPFPRLPA